ncbi:hypothetical protein GCM10027445_01450 [Amycolatopsis endophytica]|uniref:J domain-containing protein n=1 Tax=Amycolatopsis endophytica TaxID=860233 RepID=A0A853BAT3_9PSEU|nr:hypothetical protein [Amycolatopsis endophytica]NYI91516.1 hypothetical protein [Amycolatopsis endophytica]
MDEDGTGRDWTAADKAAYRRLVRAHHPDFGGDPDEFVAQLARFRADRRAGGERIVFVSRRRGLAGVFDALRQRHRRRRRPPRVQ